MRLSKILSTSYQNPLTQCVKIRCQHQQACFAKFTVCLVSGAASLYQCITTSNGFDCIHVYVKLYRTCFSLKSSNCSLSIHMMTKSPQLLLQMSRFKVVGKKWKGCLGSEVSILCTGYEYKENGSTVRG